MITVSRLRRALWGIGNEWRWGWRHVRVGRWNYLVNVAAFRALAVFKSLPGADAECHLVTDNGIVLWYRRNRGDIQGIREIFIDEIYRLPEGAQPQSLLDFGANIGMATVWLCHEYAIKRFAAYEPLPSNFSLLEKNCRANGISGQLHNAAVGTTSGSVSFDTGTESNLGRVGSGDFVVPMHDVKEIVADARFENTLLKIDVEGMERDLFDSGHGPWTNSLSMIAIEMHPQYFDIGPLIEHISSLGFRYFPPVEKSQGLARSKRERLFVREPCSLQR